MEKILGNCELFGKFMKIQGITRKIRCSPIRQDLYRLIEKYMKTFKVRSQQSS